MRFLFAVTLCLTLAAPIFAQRQQMAPRPKEIERYLDPPSPVLEYEWRVTERYCYLLLGGEQVGAYDRRYNVYRPLVRLSAGCWWWEKPCESPMSLPSGVR